MRKAQEVALDSRPYALKTLELLEKISTNTPIDHPLLRIRPIRKILVIIMASDKGLTGAFNTQIIRAANSFFKSEQERGNQKNNFIVMPIGKKSSTYAMRESLEIVDQFHGVGDYAYPEEVAPIANQVIKGFLNGRWERVVSISTSFITALKQETIVRQILPIDLNKIKETVESIVPEHGRYADTTKEEIRQNLAEAEKNIDYIFEPSPREALKSLIPHLVNMQIYHLVLEANASEHSARRVAMKTASDNADELSRKLTLIYNKARQSIITNELIEITSTQSALSGNN